MIDLSVVSEIDAPPEPIWNALIDLARYHEWNPFIREARGTPAVGARIHVRPKLSLPLPVVFRPEIVVCDKERELRWRGSFIHPWLGGGEHSFTLEPAGDGRTILVQREVFTGLLPPLLAGRLAPEVRKGFLAMNRALKERVEQARRTPAAARAAG